MPELFFTKILSLKELEGLIKILLKKKPESKPKEVKTTIGNVVFQEDSVL
jgi:hypothetical protein